ncbi:MAG: restriction endonuclease subunit S, partial [Deltaproteobacteria bacterium]|nr:restriction endonuclease subunit S [Deltaproteobacteria bacterium]
MPKFCKRLFLRDCVEVLDRFRRPLSAKSRALRKGGVPYYGATGQVDWVDEALFNERLVLIGEDGAPFLEAIKEKAYIIEGLA